jgi:hypothetical protein
MELLMRLDLTLMQVEAVRNMLADEADDDRLLADTIEGETDAYGMLSRLLNGIEREEGDRAALTEQMDARKARRDRCDIRIASLRNAVSAVVQATGLLKLTLPEATVSVRDGKPKLTIVSDDAVPDQYQVVKRSPDKRAINAAFEDADDLPNWLGREAAMPSLTIRRK